ncbi:organomercurial lyase [Parasedimentitalea psychrophila]|uniref:Organomercurial lyase n=1 Tax=Parasedimentitalea psychrophila TaxID=2997337 RepID=A0A9Y2L2L5_9RHOB|nr:organomercurial lyase [Parasedimentitalea psychrophila]WIY25729.1 organomercurial lyase [Parasedimentitalea psychrophila]
MKNSIEAQSAANSLARIDWSAVSDTQVAEAIPQLLQDWRMRKRWDAISPNARDTHKEILRSYLRSAAPPKIASLEPAILEDLQSRDLIVVKNGQITSAYPFSTIATTHAVTVDAVTNSAVCAIDALGVAAMSALASRVQCQCPICNGKIDVSIRADGLTIQAAWPATARLWAGVVDIAGCAADTQCQTMLVFCSPKHLAVWRETQKPVVRGFDLSLSQAVQLGAAIFRPFLGVSDT